jgi:membrane protein
VWRQSAEDNVFFLAGGLAFNVLLALLPFVLLLVSGMALLLGAEPEQAARTIVALLQAFLPDDAPSAAELLGSVIEDVQRTRGAVTLYAAIGFAWFSTRLFGSLRSVLAQIFDGTDRGIVVGKLFDFGATLVATLAVVVYIAISAYLDLATTRGVELLVRMGLRESSMGGITYVVGRLLAILIVFGFFYTLYHGLPRRRPSARTALTAAVAASIMFEIARSVFSVLVRHFDPSSLYTGTIAVVVAVVFWTYYGALLFLLGGELAQAVELRRTELAALERKFTAERTATLGRTGATPASTGSTPPAASKRRPG